MKSVTPFLLGIVLWNSEALAQFFRLDYQRETMTEGCMDEPLFRSSLSAKLGKEVFDTQAPQTIRILVRRMNRQVLAATLKLVNSDGIELGRRELSSSVPGCQELNESLLLATALVVDPLFLSRKPAETASKAPTTVIKPVVIEPATALPEPEKAPEWHWAARIWLGGGFTSTPVPVPMGAAEVRLHNHRLSFGLEARGQLPAVTQFGQGEVRSSVWAVSALPCLQKESLLFCAVATAGGTQNESVNVMNAQNAPTPWASAGMRAAWNFTVGPGAVAVLLEVAKPFTVTRIRLEPVEVWKTPDFVGHLGIGYGWNL